MAHRIVTVEVQGSPMEVFVFEPPGPGPHPALILCQHIPIGHTGIENDAWTLHAAERFAGHGYVVAAPFIFHWWPKSAEMELKRKAFRDDWTTADLNATFDLLAAMPGVRADRIGIVGHCWGGRVSWLGAGTNPRLAACATFYGGRVRLTMGPDTPPAIDLAPNIKCPVIGFFGGLDQGPSPEDVDVYDAALTQAGVPHVFHRYPDAGHAFQNRFAPDRYHEPSAEDAWTKVLAFFADTLKK